jgi:carbon storage regulator
MLVLSRKLNEAIIVDGHTTVRIISISGNRVKLGIEAPSSVPVHREEISVTLDAEERLGRRQVLGSV